jgi:hypothetical protein
MLPFKPRLSLNQSSEGFFVVNCLNHSSYYAVGLLAASSKKILSQEL